MQNEKYTLLHQQLNLKGLFYNLFNIWEWFDTKVYDYGQST